MSPQRTCLLPWLCFYVSTTAYEQPCGMLRLRDRVPTSGESTIALCGPMSTNAPKGSALATANPNPRCATPHQGTARLLSDGDRY
ncbi:hypothetical protein JKP88DRAFT_217575 [Tribonema minus]|uniref:Secreted protein n=1 Tax=Tribonema minus TaxID=303371 RepID=A0A836CL67_9STRA|nr:hypothetical protein JKP88DRAFT_217575 [Tribonema minus]